MYNEDFNEVRDYDEDIKEREELIEEVKKVDTSLEWNEVFPIISDLRRRWRQIAYWESAHEDALMEEFDGYLDVFYNKRKEELFTNQQKKEEIIEKAKVFASSDDFNEATKAMNDLMNDWKKIGHCGKEKDDSLWEEFNNARQTFFDRKHKNWEDLQGKFENAYEIKKHLIEQALAMKDSSEWQKTGEAFKDLMTKWKEAGSAGREHEDSLWQEFNSYRQAFYERRNAYYEELHNTQNQHYNAKKELVEKAKAVLDSQKFTKENTEFMKNLNVEWKKIGSCGKEKEDQIWAEFRTLMDDYFAELKEFNNQKHENWRQKMIDIKTRKQAMIQNQKRQIKYMQDEIVGLLGERAINEMNESIEEKKEFIIQLEKEVEELEKALNEK